MIILKDKKTVNCIFTRCFKRGPEFPTLLHHDHPHLLCLHCRWFLYYWATREPSLYIGITLFLLPNKETILPSLYCCTCMPPSSEIITLQKYHKFKLALKKTNDIEHSGKPSTRWYQLRFISRDSQHNTVCESLAYWNVHISFLAHSHPICFPFCSPHCRWACFIKQDSWVYNQ